MDVPANNGRFTRLKNHYSDSVSKLKENYDQQLEDMQETYAAKNKKKTQIFNDDRNLRSKEVEEEKQRYTTETKERVDALENRFARKLKEEQEVARRVAREQKADFGQKFDALKDSYARSFKNKNQLYDDQVKNLNRNHTRQKKRALENFNDSLASSQLMAKEGGEKMKARFDLDKRRIFDQAQGEKNLIIQNGNKRYQSAAQQHQDLVDELRKSFDNQLTVNSQNAEAQKESLASNKDQLIDSQRAMFESTIDEIQGKHQLNEERTNQENNKRVAEQTNQFEKDLGRLNAHNRSISSSGSNIEQNRLAKERILHNHESKVRSLKDQMGNQTFRHGLNTENQAEGFKQDLEAQTRESSIQLEKLERDHAKTIESTLANFRKDKEKSVETFRSEFRRAEDATTKNLDAQKKRFDSRLVEQRENFEDTISKVQDQNNLALQAFRDESADEKSKLIKSSVRKNQQEVQTLQDDFRKRMAMLEESYNLRTEQQRKENTQLKNHYEARLETLNKKFAKESEENRILASERKFADNLAKDRLNHIKVQAHKKEIMGLRSEFDRKLSREKTFNDIRVDKMTQRYERRIDSLVKDNARTMKLKEMKFRNEYEKLVKMSQLREDTLKNQYDMKVEQLKLADQVSRAHKQKAEGAS